MNDSRPDPLLQSKLHVPRPRGPLIERKELLERLQAAATERALVLISAPPGFGKTSLLAAWASGAQLPVGWLSLDEDDNDPARFLRYLASALHIAGALPLEAIQPVLTAETLAPRAALAYLLSRIESEPNFSSPGFILVLDDFHRVVSPVVHGLLQYLLEHLPPSLHLILATRADPPIPLGRLRASGDMLELRASDLRFSTAESAAYLAQMSLSLAEPQVQELDSRVEGWIAGLQMAALALQRISDPQETATFIRAFSGSHRFILDYLIEEVISRQGPELQAFLLHTAILDRFSAELCAEINTIPTAEASAILDRLESSNLFLVPLDNERRWFRYHHLFADLLRARLQQTQGELLPQLHLLAARWFERNGYLYEAVQHAFSAGDVHLAAHYLATHSLERWALSDISFMSQVNRLPAEVIRQRPLLGILRVWTMVLSGQLQLAMPLVEAIDKALESSPPSPEVLGMRGFTGLLRVYITDLSGIDNAASLPEPGVLDNVPAQSLAMRNSADVALALLYSTRGRFAEADAILQKTIRRDKELEGTTAVPISVSLLARNSILQGRLKEAAALLEDHIAWVEERGAWRFYLAGNLHTNLAEVLREWNRLEEAVQLLRAGRLLNEAWDIPNALVSGYLEQSRLLRARGDFQGAREALEQGERIVTGRFLPLDARKELEIEQVRLWLDTGELEPVRVWAAQLPPPDPGDFRQEAASVTLARFLLAERRFAECHATLQPMVACVRSGARPGRLALLLLLDALALDGAGDVEQSLAQLALSLELAAPQGYTRAFLECGEAMRVLLEKYLRRPNAPHLAYAQSLLAAFGSRALPAMDGLVEPLTPRELEVLRLVCEGLSNQAIAARLTITVAAVKKHTGNIYGKLGVTSRTQAVRRAMALGLAGPPG